MPKDKLKILNPKIGFYQWIIQVKDYFIPSIMVRNCCSTYKEGQVKKHYDNNANIIMVTGVRKYESVKRSEYDYVMDSEFRERIHGKDNLCKNWTTFAPAVEWTDEEVWLYTLMENIPYNHQYDVGFNRCGCLICPFQADYIDLLIQENYPNQWKRWLGILQKNYEKLKIKERLKWSLEEWQQGKWKEGKSKVYFITKSKMTDDKVKEVAIIQNISEGMAKKYWKNTCSCGKHLNPTEIAMYLKLYGRYEYIEEDERTYLCKKCLCNDQDIKAKEYTEMTIKFLDQGCNLF